MFCYEAAVGGPPLQAVAQALAAEYALPLRLRSAAPPAAPVLMRWHRGDQRAARHAFYADLLAHFDAPLAELIIHPGIDRAALASFSRSADLRVADYEFFRSATFAGLVQQHGIDVVGRDDLR
jgi:hypothetical protein